MPGNSRTGRQDSRTSRTEQQNQQTECRLGPEKHFSDVLELWKKASGGPTFQNELANASRNGLEAEKKISAGIGR